MARIEGRWISACVGALMCIFLGSLVATQAEAGIYRCKGADGKVTYTSDATACSGAVPHELKGRIESVGSTAPPARALRNHRRSSPKMRMENAEEARWRAKKRTAEQKIEQLAYETEQLRRMVTWCNRGGNLYVTQETGLKKNMKCSDAKFEFAESTTRKYEAERYLREGLEEDCRRSGCLPGWLR